MISTQFLKSQVFRIAPLASRLQGLGNQEASGKLPPRSIFYDRSWKLSLGIVKRLKFHEDCSHSASRFSQRAGMSLIGSACVLNQGLGTKTRAFELYVKYAPHQPKEEFAKT